MPPNERNRQAAGGSRWSATRPSLEYQHAFDLCAVEVHRTEGPVALFASSPFYTREMLHRLRGCNVTLVPLGDWDAAGIDLAVPAQDVQAGAVVWAGPEHGNGEQMLERIDRALLPGGRLCIVASGWLARFLPEWQRDADRPGQRPAGLRRIAGWLRRSGLVVESVRGFHGLESTLWGYASRLASAIGRPDLADRCHFQMRATYAVSGWQARWTPVQVVVAHKGSGHD